MQRLHTLIVPALAMLALVLHEQLAPARQAPSTANATQPAPAAGDTPGQNSTGQPANSQSAGQNSDSGNRSKDPLDLSLEELSRQDVRSSQGAGPGSGQSRVSQSTSGSTVTSSQFDSAGTGGLGELFNQAPEVNVRRISAVNLDPRVRGFNTSELNASADGMTELKSRLDIDSLFSQVDAANVDSVSVTDGPYTSLYGPGFAFLTARFANAPRYADGFEVHDVTTFSNDSNGRQINAHERLLFGGPDWGVNVSYSVLSGGEYLSGHDADAFRVPAAYRQQDVFLASSIDLTKQVRLEFNYVHVNLYNVELPGVSYDLDRSDNDQFDVRLVWQADPNGLENLVLQFWEQRTAYNGDSGRPSKQLTFIDLLLDQALPSFRGETGFNDGVSESAGIRTLCTIGSKDSARLTVGADYRRVLIDYEEFAVINATGLPTENGQFGIPKSSLEDGGAFFHFIDPVSKQLTLTLGGRYDHTQAWFDKDAPIAQPFAPGDNQPTNDLYMLYTTAEYKPTDWLKFTGGAAYAMREANLTELYSDGTVVPLVRFGNSILEGNSQLAPEKDLQFDLGVSTKWENFSLGARAFYSDIRDYILPVASDLSLPVAAGIPAPTQLGRTVAAFGINSSNPLINAAADTAALGYRYTNLDLATMTGGEVFGEWKMLSWLALNGQMAYVKGVDEAPVRYITATNTFVPLGGHEPLPNIYPFNGTLTLRVFEPRKNSWEVDFVTRMVAGRHSVALSLAEVPSPGFTTFGLRGSYRLNEHLRIYSSIENLFDRSYSEPGSLAIVTPHNTIGFVSEPGFSWIVGFEASF
jgi:outer membrane receptor protein involved in Fe transport